MPGLFRRVQANQDSLSDEALMPLKSYKYQSVDLSYISRYVLKHYWNAFVEVLPLWLAPNMVTLLGFFFIIGNVILIELYVPDLVGPLCIWHVDVSRNPNPLHTWSMKKLTRIKVFHIGQRRWETGTENWNFKWTGRAFRVSLSPKKDNIYLDRMLIANSHGIDSLNCTMASLLNTAAMGFGSTQLGAYTALVPCLAMYFSTWETFHTHTLYLGYFNGPTEGLIIAIAIMVASGIYGPQIWARPITDLLPYPELFGNNSVKDLWIPVLCGSFFFAHLPGCVYNVVSARKKQNLPLAPLIKEIVPMVAFTGCNLAWLFSPYSTLLAENRLVLYCTTISFVFGRMTTKIILAHLLKQPFPYWTVLITPLFGGAILGNLPRFGFPMVSAAVELFYLRAYFLFAFVIYMYWAVLVINRITTFLGINCLTIRKDKSVARERAYREVGESDGFKNH